MTTTKHEATVGSDRNERAATLVVGFLGTGRMGGPMAANLARGGFDVRVWNRTAGRAEALAADGAVVASSPAQAVRGATIVITMLADGPATEQAAIGPDGFLTAGLGVIWVQMGTIGIEWTTRLAAIAAARGAVFVDAPVSGSEGPARAGQLTILASGPGQARDVLAPVFGVLGRATAWLGPAGHGTRAKLVLNNWLADLTETTAESLSFARHLGLDPADIVDLLQSNPLGAPYAVQKARVMLAGDFSPAFALKQPSRTPSSRRRPRTPAASRCRSPARCSRAGGTPRPAGTPMMTSPLSTSRPDELPPRTPAATLPNSEDAPACAPGFGEVTVVLPPSPE